MKVCFRHFKSESRKIGIIVENNILDQDQQTTENNIVERCEQKIDEHLSLKEKVLFKKSRFSEMSEDDGVLYRFKDFFVEIIDGRLAVCAKYNSKYFYRDDYANTDEFCDAGIQMFEEFYNNPIMTKNAIKRLLYRLINK